LRLRNFEKRQRCNQLMLADQTPTKRKFMI
jgi:hypothetical protein